MRLVARMTGLNPHVIRVWERRYGAITPARTSTNRRLYSPEDVERLRCLRRVTEAGHQIGRVATLPTADLRALASELDSATASHPRRRRRPEDPLANLEACLTAAADLDAEAFAHHLGRAALGLEQTAFLEQVVSPLLRRIGDLWQDGTLRIANEHMVSSVLRTVLGTMRTAYNEDPSAPRLVVSTLAGQLHEFGALLSAAVAGAEGWAVTYLGPNLPAEEIAHAATVRKARAVALSLVYPSDDFRIAGELRKLRHYLPSDTLIVVGGRAIESYQPVLAEIQAEMPASLDEFRGLLRSAASQPPVHLAKEQDV
jgi:methanogenic corrinoid protein MtbC1